MSKKSFSTPAMLIGSAMALAISTATISVPATAQQAKAEKCYGVAAAGKNGIGVDCLREFVTQFQSQNHPPGGIMNRAPFGQFNLFFENDLSMAVK